MDRKNTDQTLIESLIGFIDALPVLPVVFHKIIELLQKEHTTAKEIASVINMDTGLAARILRLANSARYSLPNPVTTVEHAVTLVGFTEVKNLAMALKFVSTFPEGDENVLERGLFWEHSLACGVCARILSESLMDISPGEAFTGGLMHDMGKLVLDAHFQGPWKNAIRHAHKTGWPLPDSETEIMGAPHTKVGEMLATHWGLPDIYKTAILHHHSPPDKTQVSPRDLRYAKLICTANAIAQWLDTATDGYTKPRYLTDDEMKLTGIGCDSLDSILGRTVSELVHWKRLLGFGKGDGSPGDENGETDDANAESVHPDIWYIGPPKPLVPSPRLILESMGYIVSSSKWEEKILDLTSGVPKRAVIMDLGAVRIEAKKFIRFLSLFRARCKSPVVIVAPNGPELPKGLEKHNIYSYKKLLNRGAFLKALQVANGLH